jgi:hypothetical protein
VSDTEGRPGPDQPNSATSFVSPEDQWPISFLFYYLWRGCRALPTTDSKTTQQGTEAYTSHSSVAANESLWPAGKNAGGRERLQQRVTLAASATSISRAPKTLNTMGLFLPLWFPLLSPLLSLYLSFPPSPSLSLSHTRTHCLFQMHPIPLLHLRWDIVALQVVSFNTCFWSMAFLNT